jgi:hypothetical protein
MQERTLLKALLGNLYLKYKISNQNFNKFNNLKKTVMKIVKSLFIFLSIIFVGCGGVKFAQAPINLDLPESFKQRSAYPAGVMGYQFQDLIGSILLIKRDVNPIILGIIRPDSFISKMIPITDPNNYYKSRIQKGAELKGSYLAFASNLSKEDLVEYELIDIARAGIEFTSSETFSQIVNKSKQWVRNNPKTDSSNVRLWIRAVVLTKESRYAFTKIDINAKGQVGDVVGVSTGIYHKNENSNRGVLISFEAIDIDVLAQQSLSDSERFSTELIIRKLKSSFYTKPIVDKIN